MRTAHLKSGTGVGKGRRAGQPFRACGSQEEVDEADEKEASSSGLGPGSSLCPPQVDTPTAVSRPGAAWDQRSGLPIHVGACGKEVAQ